MPPTLQLKQLLPLLCACVSTTTTQLAVDWLLLAYAGNKTDSFFAAPCWIFTSAVLHVSAQTSVSELYKEYVIFGVEEEYTAERFPLAEVKGACTSKTVFNIFPFTSIKQSGTL